MLKRHFLRDWPGSCRAVLAFACASGLGACAAGPDFVEPASPVGAGFARGEAATTAVSAGAGGVSQRLLQGADVPAQWWKLFRSPQIVALVEEAIYRNPDLAAAELALRQAREIAMSTEGEFWPQLAGNGNFNRQKGLAPASSANPTGVGSSSLYSLYGSTADVGYTPDIFGRVTRQWESENANADYERFQMEAAYLALSTNVIAAAIKDASCAKQIAVTKELIAAYQQQLDLLEKRFALGAVSPADVESQRVLAAQALAALAPLEKERAQTRHQLMVYLGRYPNEDRGEAVSLDSLHLPGELPLSLPSDLVRQRPDIRAAESRLRVASAQIGVATANMLPQITLKPSTGMIGFALDGLFAASGFTWGAAAIGKTQFMDGGVLAYQREAAVTAFEQASEQYKSTVLKSFQNVADALTALQQDARELRAQTAAERAAAESLRIARVQYSAGSTAYWSVLTAERSLLIARLARVRAEAARHADTVALFHALGGGWWNRVDETPAATPLPKDLISLSPLAAAIRSSVRDPRKSGAQP